MCFSTHLQKHSYPSLFLQLVIFMLSSCVPRLPSLSNWAVTESCFSAFSTTESSLCQGAKAGGGGLSGWAHSKGPSGKKGGGMEGGPEWEESPGCQGVTSLDTTSSPPGNRCDSPPCYPLPPSLSLSQLVNNTRTYTHTHIKKNPLAVLLCCFQVHSLHVQ